MPRLLNHTCILTVLLVVPQYGCKDRNPDRDEHAQQSTPTLAEVSWAAGTQTADPEVNSFVRQAVQHCISGDYDAYRKLWRFDHQPTSKKHFDRLWRAVESVDVKRLKQVKVRREDGTIDDQAQAVYVLHAYIKIKPQYVEQSNGRLQDRDMILQIANDDGTWRFLPAPKEIKELILTMPDPVSTSQPTATAPSGD